METFSNTKQAVRLREEEENQVQENKRMKFEISNDDDENRLIIIEDDAGDLPTGNNFYFQSQKEGYTQYGSTTIDMNDIKPVETQDITTNQPNVSPTTNDSWDEYGLNDQDLIGAEDITIQLDFKNFTLKYEAATDLFHIRQDKEVVIEKFKDNRWLTLTPDIVQEIIFNLPRVQANLDPVRYGVGEVLKIPIGHKFYIEMSGKRYWTVHIRILEYNTSGELVRRMGGMCFKFHEWSKLSKALIQMKKDCGRLNTFIPCYKRHNINFPTKPCSFCNPYRQ